jgi:hypothetical protein
MESTKFCFIHMGKMYNLGCIYGGEIGGTLRVYYSDEVESCLLVKSVGSKPIMFLNKQLVLNKDADIDILITESIIKFNEESKSDALSDIVVSNIFGISSAIKSINKFEKDDAKRLKRIENVEKAFIRKKITDKIPTREAIILTMKEKVNGGRHEEVS